MGVAGCHQWEVQPFCELGQPLHTSGITLDQVVLDLNERVVLAEGVHELVNGLFGLRTLLAIDEAGDLALAAAAERDQTLGVRGEVRWIERWRTRVVGGQVCRGWLPGARAFVGQRDQAAEVGVTLLVFGQQCQVDETGAMIEEAVEEGQLDADNWLHTSGGTRLGELHRTVQPVMVGDGEGRVAEAGGLVSHFLGQGGAFEEGVAGMQVQLDGESGCHIRSRTEVLDSGKADAGTLLSSTEF